MNWLQPVEQLIVLLSQQVPLELFVFVGALLEEIIAPIPSMLVMTTAGLLARYEMHTPFFLLWLVAVGNMGKIFGSLGWYVVGDKVEDIMTGRLARFFGITHHDIERVRAKLTGNTLQDGAFIFFLRAIPIFPSLAVSLASGVLKIKKRAFIAGSYLGNSCKDFFYIMFGYFGVGAVKDFLLEVERVRLGINLIIITVTGVLLVLAYRSRHRGHHLLLRLIAWLKSKVKA